MTVHKVPTKVLSPNLSSTEPFDVKLPNKRTFRPKKYAVGPYRPDMWFLRYASRQAYSTLIAMTTHSS